MTDPIYLENEMVLAAMEPEEGASWIDTLLEILTLPELYPDLSVDGCPF